MHEYKTLGEMKIRNPRQIERYSVQTIERSGEHVDVLRIIYKRKKGSFLPESKRFRFPQIKTTMENSGRRKIDIRWEESPFLQKAISELDMILSTELSKKESIKIILDRAMISIFFVVGLLLPVLSMADEKTRFTNLENGTVPDNKTDLIWFKNANCFRWKNWDKAMELVNKLKSGQCGLSDGSIEGDWRLPSVWEWKDFLDQKYREPALSNTQGTGKWKPGDPFDNVQNDYYWTSSAFPDPTGRFNNAYCVHLYFGVQHHKEQALGLFVWPVRDNF